MSEIGQEISTPGIARQEGAICFFDIPSFCALVESAHGVGSDTVSRLCHALRTFFHRLDHQVPVCNRVGDAGLILHETNSGYVYQYPQLHSEGVIRLLRSVWYLIWHYVELLEDIGRYVVEGIRLPERLHISCHVGCYFRVKYFHSMEPTGDVDFISTDINLANRIMTAKISACDVDLRVSDPFLQTGRELGVLDQPVWTRKIRVRNVSRPVLVHGLMFHGINWQEVFVRQEYYDALEPDEAFIPLLCKEHAAIIERRIAEDGRASAGATGAPNNAMHSDANKPRR